MVFLELFFQKSIDSLIGTFKNYFDSNHIMCASGGAVTFSTFFEMAYKTE